MGCNPSDQRLCSKGKRQRYHDKSSKHTAFVCRHEPCFVPGTVIVSHDGHQAVVHAEDRHKDEALQLEINAQDRHSRLGKGDEDGIEASAVTIVAMMEATAAMPEEHEVKEFYADEPFQFLIYTDLENSENEILFYGQVVE